METPFQHDAEQRATPQGGAPETESPRAAKPDTERRGPASPKDPSAAASRDVPQGATPLPDRGDADDVSRGRVRSTKPPASTAAESSEFPRLQQPAPSGIDARRVTLLNDVNLRVKIELGRTRMLVEDVLRLAEGSVVELDKLAGDPVDVYVNDRLIARGEVLVLNDNFCVRVSEVLSRDPHRVSA